MVHAAEAIAYKAYMPHLQRSNCWAQMSREGRSSGRASWCKATKHLLPWGRPNTQDWCRGRRQGRGCRHSDVAGGHGLQGLPGVEVGSRRGYRGGWGFSPFSWLWLTWESL